MQLFTPFLPGLYALIAAIIGGIASVLAMTRDLETIGFGILASLYILPSIAAFELSRKFISSPIIPHIVFWLMAAAIIGYFYYLYNRSLVLEADDGSGLMALHTAYAAGGAALFAYLALCFSR